MSQQQQHLIDNDERCNREAEQERIDYMRDIADNPDGVYEGDLENLLAYLGHFNKPLRQVKELWGELTDDTVKATQQLRTYAKHKLLAMQFRKAGKIESALIREASCEVVYKSIPEQFKW